MSAAHILVVDDEPDIRGLVQEILEDEGYAVVIAENGAAARRALRERRPDLILLDIWMPDLDGISLLKEWAADDGLPCPVIMMSGLGTVETGVEATRLGAYDFLEKPYDPDRLLDTVEEALVHHAGRAGALAEAERTRCLVRSLSPRQLAVLEGLVDGLPNKLIAHRLELSPRTVEMHRMALMEKLGVRSLSEAVRIAVSAGVGTSLPA
jgi:FixJ family two-component response regulator